MRWTSCLAWLAAVAVCGRLGIAVEQPAAPLRPTSVVRLDNVRGRIDHLCADVEHKRVFVCAVGQDAVEVIDADAEKVIQEIRGLKKPQGCGFVPELNRLAVASDADGTCRLFDAANFRELRVIDLKDDADNVRYDPQARHLWVGYGDGALASIDPESGKVLADVRLKGHPESFQLEPTGGRIFVNVPQARHVAVVDRQLKKVVDQWPVHEAKGNFPMALDEANRRLLIACRDPAKLLALDTQSGKTVAAIDCVGDADDVWYDHASQRIYVTGGEGFISVIQQIGPDRYESLAKIPTAPGARTSLFVPAWRKLFVALPRRGDQPAELRVFETPDKNK